MLHQQNPALRWAGLTLRIIVAAAALAAAVLQAMAEAKTFKGPTWLPVVLAISVAVFAFIDNARTSIRTIRAPKREGAWGRIQKTSAAALVQIADTHPDLLIELMGVSVFVPKRRWLIGPMRLVRPSRFRLSDAPQASSVTWSAGKGCIGVSFRDKRAVYCHWAPLARRYGGKPVTESEFHAIPADKRWNFTREEFLGIVAKYAEILAVPIMSEDGGKIRGVVAIDRPYKAGDNRKLLDNEDVRGIAEGLAVSIRDDLP